MAIDGTKITVTKLGAAQRQLQTAIRLWFTGGDPVSIHTLAYAAYEIIHAVSKRLNPGRRDLLFDTLVVKDEHRSEFNLLLKQHANFFKHGNRPQDERVDFAPVVSDLFLIYSIMGLSTCDVARSDEERAFMGWLHIHNPEFLTDQGRKVLADLFEAKAIDDLRTLTKQEFFYICQHADALVEGRGHTYPLNLREEDFG